MENFGTYANKATVNNGTAHGPGYSGGSGIGHSYTLPFGETVYDDYHVYAIEWSPNSIVWSVDGASYHTVTPASLPAGTASNRGSVIRSVRIANSRHCSWLGALRSQLSNRATTQSVVTQARLCDTRANLTK